MHIQHFQYIKHQDKLYDTTRKDRGSDTRLTSLIIASKSNGGR